MMWFIIFFLGLVGFFLACVSGVILFWIGMIVLMAIGGLLGYIVGDSPGSIAGASIGLAIYLFMCIHGIIKDTACVSGIGEILSSREDGIKGLIAFAITAIALAIYYFFY